MLLHVSGSKGGIGKSIASVAISDSLMRHGYKVGLIESDESANDVGKIFASSAIPKFFLTDTRDNHQLDGMVQFLRDNSGHIFVQNAGAREVCLKRDESAPFYLTQVLEKSQENLETVWLLTADSEIDGLVALSRFMEMVPWRVHILHNLIKGGDLRSLAGSRIEREVRDRGGRLLTFPECARYVAYQISNHRKAPDIIAQSGPSLLHKAALAHWRKQIDQVISEIFRK